MIRFALILTLLALLACGGSDTAETGDADAAKATAAAPAAEKAPAPTAAAPPAGEAAAAPEAPANPDADNCLSLVSQAKFADAVPVCMAALNVDPNNTAVADALDTAKAETAKAAAGAAAGSATDAASSGVKDLTGGVLGGSATE